MDWTTVAILNLITRYFRMYLQTDILYLIKLEGAVIGVFTIRIVVEES